MQVGVEWTVGNEPSVVVTYAGPEEIFTGKWVTKPQSEEVVFSGKIFAGSCKIIEDGAARIRYEKDDEGRRAPSLGSFSMRPQRRATAE